MRYFPCRCCCVYMQNSTRQYEKINFQFSELIAGPAFVKVRTCLPTPGRIIYVYSIDFNTEIARTHPGPDRLRLHFRF